MARDYHFTGFPDFEQFYVPGFPGRTQIQPFKSVASTISPRPRDLLRIAPSSHGWNMISHVTFDGMFEAIFEVIHDMTILT